MKKGILTSILIATAASVVLLSGVLARVPQVPPSRRASRPSGSRASVR